MQRLRSTTKAFQSIAQKYTKVALRKSQVIHSKKPKGSQNNYIKQVFKGINVVEESKEGENSMEAPMARKGRTYVDTLRMSESNQSKREEEFYDASSSQLYKSALDQNNDLIKSEIEGGNSPSTKQRQKSIVVPKVIYENSMENLISSFSSYRLDGLQIVSPILMSNCRYSSTITAMCSVQSLILTSPKQSITSTCRTQLPHPRQVSTTSESTTIMQC